MDLAEIQRRVAAAQRAAEAFLSDPEYDLNNRPDLFCGAKPGLQRRKRPWSKQRLVDELKRAAEELGWPITIHEFVGFAGTATNTIYKHFPRGWYDLLDEAGIEPGGRGQRARWSDEELLAEYGAVYERFGRHPTLDELDQWAEPSMCTFKNRLGRKRPMERRYEEWVAAGRPTGDE